MKRTLTAAIAALLILTLVSPTFAGGLVYRTHVNNPALVVYVEYGELIYGNGGNGPDCAAGRGMYNVAFWPAGYQGEFTMGGTCSDPKMHSPRTVARSGSRYHAEVVAPPFTQTNAPGEITFGYDLTVTANVMRFDWYMISSEDFPAGGHIEVASYIGQFPTLMAWGGGGFGGIEWQLDEPEYFRKSMWGGPIVGASNGYQAVGLYTVNASNGHAFLYYGTLTQLGSDVVLPSVVAGERYSGTTFIVVGSLDEVNAGMATVIGG